jgi:histone-lysine N-methyltransferase SETMAR
MDKTEYRAVIKFFLKEGLTPNEMHSKFIKVYGDSSASFSTIKKWAAEFKRGRTSLQDNPRRGRPKCAATPEMNVLAVHVRRLTAMHYTAANQTFKDKN